TGPLALLWEAYRAGPPDGFGYPGFCDLYRVWAGRLKPTMRQTHLAGEKLFVDFAGRTGEVVDGLTGEIIPVQIFVAVLGASSFTYAEAVWSQKLPDWIAAPVRAFAYFRRRRPPDGQRQPQGRDHQGLLSRADGQPDLCRHGAALRHRHCSGAPLQATRQGQS